MMHQAAKVLWMGIGEGGVDTNWQLRPDSTPASALLHGLRALLPHLLSR